ncbi:PREDICTED: bifunctional endo-1 4-beta-xylanase [Prunus dulcis]|uniref:PREDICTED: bifunctional endo-1 4-beta-xylanase n=1 Tax=Prunus dulcis TaxID=3755 RepID=A0A5E4FPK7_PRUDU|nr:uncharacterized protein LOC117624224 [Prunus dulcis]KAI5331441.1 hypothetical protein L3X38_021567 [Prunus dulcis]VVA29403.1 PREDICTED: bifunctional endo-1 4-beta-xylanase [Prunus dulcis]
MSWRRQQGEGGSHSGYYSQPWKNHWSSLQKKRKPQDHSVSVPAWEKQFCMRAGSVPWGKLVETKKYLSLHKNIVQWNDSAAEEAFNDAKSWFWAEINGLPCNISLPDPDAYIDDVDWSSSNIDPEVILDLERSREPKPYYYDHGQTLDPEDVVIIGLHQTVSNETVACTWGDFEEDLKNKENVHENPWEPASGHQSKAAAMGGGWGSNTCNKWENNYSRDEWKYGSRKTSYYGRGGHGVSWGNFKSDVNGGSWWQNSRYKISTRFLGDDGYQKAGGRWRKEEQSSRW